MDPSHSISFKSDGLNTNINFFHHDSKIAWRRARFNRFKEGKEGQNGLTSRDDFVSFNHLNGEDDRRRCPGLEKVRKRKKEKRNERN
jgi:hypothetical protein